MAARRRILVVNPNTSQEVTDAFVAAAREGAPEGVAFDSVTGQFGARIVSTEAENVIAGHSALELVARHWQQHDAVILAISFDTALLAIRPLLPVPVIGITEAALRAAQAVGPAIGVVFFGEVSRGLYTHLIAGYGAQTVGFEAVEIASAADYLAPDARDRSVIEACQRLDRQGADAIVVCGAAIAGIARRLQSDVRVPLFDGTEAVAMSLSAIASAVPTPPLPVPVGDTTGLSDALAALLRGQMHADGGGIGDG
jgi:allantoin racemase